MVIVSNIDVDRFIDLGFISKSQAMFAYKGIKSLKNELIEDFLERTYPLIVHIIHQNQISDLFDEETSKRIKISYSGMSDFKKIEKEFLKLSNYKYKYIKSLREYKLVVEQLNCIQDDYDQLTIEIDKMAIDINNSNKVMELDMKKTLHETDCSICSSTIEKEEIVYDMCHNFHVRCLTVWLIKNNTCPYCRKILF